MGLIATPTIGRRRFVAGGLAAAGTLILPAGLAAEAGLVATPRTTAGPFYPVKFPADVDSDLVVLRGSAARAEGTVTHVTGRVLGLDGRPIPGATVEIWQCDARGRYLHPGDTGGRPRDKAFQGYGRDRLGRRRRATASAPSGRCPIRGARRTSISPSRRRSGASSSPRCMSPASPATRATTSIGRSATRASAPP